MRYTKSHNAGFTLIETIAVLIILAIVAAVAISRSGSSEPNLRAELNNLKAALRYAQQMSISSDNTSTFGISVAANNYTLTWSGTGSDPNILLPGESLKTHTFKGGVTASTATFMFNEWGGTTGNQVTLTDGVETPKIITVIGETGYAHE